MNTSDRIKEIIHQKHHPKSTNARTKGAIEEHYVPVYRLLREFKGAEKDVRAAWDQFIAELPKATQDEAFTIIGQVPCVKQSLALQFTLGTKQPLIDRFEATPQMLQTLSPMTAKEFKEGLLELTEQESMVQRLLAQDRQAAGLASPYPRTK